ARYQLRHRVAARQADKLVETRVEHEIKRLSEPVSEEQRKALANKVRKDMEAVAGKTLEKAVEEAVEELLQEKKEAPFGGLVGVDLVNVLELNLALQQRMKRLAVSLH